MTLISKSNNIIRFLFVGDIYQNYLWFVILKDIKGITTTNAFQKLLDESNHKSNKMWV